MITDIKECIESTFQDLCTNFGFTLIQNLINIRCCMRFKCEKQSFGLTGWFEPNGIN